MIDSIDPAELKRLRGIWSGMIARCHNENHKAYRHYGGRGIFVCPEWLESFETFAADVGARPSPKHSLDRRNNNEGYCKANCRWATRREQALNRRGNRLMTHDGRTQNLTTWCEELNLDRSMVGTRLKYGWPDSIALTAPRGTVYRVRRYERGEEKGNAKLSVGLVMGARFIRHLHPEVKQESLADALGVSLSTLQAALHGTTWRHAPGPIEPVNAAIHRLSNGGTPLKSSNR